MTNRLIKPFHVHLPTLIGSSIVRDLPMDSVHLQAFGGLTLFRLLGKINNGRVTVNHPVIGLLVCGNDYANGMDRDSISTLYQEVIDAIQTTQPDTHIIVFAIPPRNFDVKTSDIILLNHTLSQIPHKTIPQNYFPTRHVLKVWLSRLFEYYHQHYLN